LKTRLGNDDKEESFMTLQGYYIEWSQGVELHFVCKWKNVFLRFCELNERKKERKKDSKKSKEFALGENVGMILTMNTIISMLWKLSIHSNISVWCNLGYVYNYKLK